MDDVLKKIADFAARAHRNQKRKYADELYIRHPERVMYLCLEYTSERSVLAAALLHDVLEDTVVTEQELKSFLKRVMAPDEAEKTLQLVVDLTDVYIKSEYPKLNRKTRKEREAKRLGEIHPDAQMVKYADIIDNASDITPNDPDFAQVYLSEAQWILRQMNHGNKELRTKAEHTVEKCRNML